MEYLGLQHQSSWGCLLNIQVPEAHVILTASPYLWGQAWGYAFHIYIYICMYFFFFFCCTLGMWKYLGSVG